MDAKNYTQILAIIETCKENVFDAAIILDDNIHKAAFNMGIIYADLTKLQEIIQLGE